MKNRYSELHKVWLFDLAHDPKKMSEMQIVQGFIKFYALEGLTLENVQQDIVYHTVYGIENCTTAMKWLKESLERFALK